MGRARIQPVPVADRGDSFSNRLAVRPFQIGRVFVALAVATQQMREVLLDENRRRSLALAGAQQARRFHWDRTAREVLDIYREIIPI